MAAVNNEISFEVERLATKTICAAQYLADTIQDAASLQKLENRVKRYVRQASLIVTWKRGSGVCQMVGSVAKTAGGVMVLAAPLHPKLSLAVNAGHRLWKLGSGLKVLTAIGGMLRELWKNGSRNALVEYTKNVALITSRLGVFQEIITDLQCVTSQLKSNSSCFDTPGEIMQTMSEFIPQNHLVYAYHIIKIVSGDEHYSPLFDLTTVTSDLTNTSDLAQIIREVEGFRFTEFANDSDAKALVAIGSFLHISRELLDFLDGFQKVTDADCRFLQECLNKFTDESVSIIKVVSLLNEIGKAAKNTKQSNISMTSLETNLTSSNQEHSNKAVETMNDQLHCDKEKKSEEGKPIQNDTTEVAIQKSETDNLTHVNNLVKTVSIISNSKHFVNKAVSSVSAVLCKGTEAMSNFKKRDTEEKHKSCEKEGHQYNESSQSLNRI